MNLFSSLSLSTFSSFFFQYHTIITFNKSLLLKKNKLKKLTCSKGNPSIPNKSLTSSSKLDVNLVEVEVEVEGRFELLIPTFLMWYYSSFVVSSSQFLIGSKEGCKRKERQTLNPDEIESSKVR